jgi:hypothetical protein
MNNKSILEVDEDGNKRWISNNECHREDGPAVEWKSGYKAWYIYGKRHRTDGPAIIFASGAVEWWLNNEMLLKDEWFKKLTPEQQYDYLWRADE